MLRQREDMEARLAKIRAKEKAQREKYLKDDQSYKKRKTATGADKGNEFNEEQFVLDDYDSDIERTQLGHGADGMGLSAATLELMEKLGMTRKKEEEDEIQDETKVSNFSLEVTPPNHSRLSTALERIPSLHSLSTNFVE